MNKTELFIKIDNYENESVMFDDTYLAGSVYGTVLGLEFQTDVSDVFSVGDIITIDKTDKSINPWVDGTASIIGITSSSVFPAPGSLVFTDRPLQLPISFTSNENGVIYQGTSISSDWNQVDLSDDVAFPITFNIADVREINNRNGAYSKTIVIPGTKDNNKVFKYIFDIQGIDNYDTRVRVKANVVVDTIPVLEGYIQLDTINCDDNQYWTYNCIIYGENANFSKNIDQNALLNSLDFSEFNHYKTLDAITQSWAGDYTYGYYYPWVDYNSGKNPVDIFPLNSVPAIAAASQLSPTNVNFKPSIYVKQYWDKIFKLYGYSYESEFLNSEAFTSLVIPTNVKVIPNDDDWRFNSSFKAGLTASAFSFQGLDTSIPIPSVANQIPLQDDFLNNWGMSVDDPFFYNPQATFVDIGGSFRYYNQYQGTVPKNQKIVLNLDYKITPIGNVGIDGLGFLLFYRLYKNNVLLSQRKIQTFGGAASFFNVGIGNFFYQNNYDYVINNYGSMDNYTTSSFDRRQMQVVYDTSVDGALNNLDTLEVRVGMAVFATNVADGFDASNFTTTVYRTDFYPSTNGYDGCYFYNDINTTSLPSQPYRLNDSIPGNIKQIDFINSIIKMFNLYLSQDKVDPKKIYIEPRDQFYGTDFVDWSSKLDLSKDILHKPIVDRKKRVLMSYKEDKDLINTYYKSNFNEIYGQYEYLTGNEFDTSEQKIELIFSPSPLSNRKKADGLLDGRLIYTQILDPKGTINTENANIVDCNIRILYKKNVPLVGTNFRIFDNQSYYTYNTYPYAGHLDDPTSPGLDLSFIEPIELFYEWRNFGYTNNNLYTLYYEQFFEEVYGLESKHIVAYVYLTAQDILDFDYRKLVYLDSASSGTGGYFRVNKIEYDPFNKMSYKVELIKVLNNFKSQYSKKLILDSTTTGVGLSLPQWGTGLVTDGSYNSGKDNIIAGVYNSVRTDLNIIGGVCNQVLVGGSNIVTGYRNNTISENSGIISGGKSTLYGTGRYSNIIGGSSQSLSGRYSSIIGGCNNKIDIYSSNNQILGGCNNIVGYNSTGTSSISQTSNSLILGGINNKIEVGPTPSATDNVFILGGVNNTIAAGVTNSFIVGGENFTATQSNTIYLQGSVLINGSPAGGGTPIPTGEVAYGNGTGITSTSNFKFTSGRSVLLSNNALTDASSSTGLAFGTDGSTLDGNNNMILSSKSSYVDGGYNSIITSAGSCVIIGTGTKYSNIIGSGTSCVSGYNNTIIGSRNSCSGYVSGYSNTIMSSGGSVVDGYYNSIISASTTGIGNAPTYNSIIIGGKKHNMSPNDGVITNSSIIAGCCHYLQGVSDGTSIISGYKNNIINSNNSVILGGNNLTLSSEDNTVLVPSLIVNDNISFTNVSGTATITAGVSVVVNNTSVTSGSKILVTGDGNSTFYVTNIVAATSFTINAGILGTYTIYWLIIN